MINQTSKYTCKENKELVKNKKQIDENIDLKKNLMLLMQEVEKDLKVKLLNQGKVLEVVLIKILFAYPFLN